MRNATALACALILSASLTLTRSAAAPQAEAGAAAAADELAQLERLAEESFVQDDLEAAVALYRQVADRLKATSEKTRISMTIAYLEHLLGRDSDALGTVTEGLAATSLVQFSRTPQ